MMSKKGPAYIDCNEFQSSCTRRSKDPRNGCPTCEYTIQYKIFLDEVAKELKYLKRSTRLGHRTWPLRHLLKLVNDVAYMSISNKTPNRKWTVRTGNLVSVYRGELSKIKALESAKLAQSLQTEG